MIALALVMAVLCGSVVLAAWWAARADADEPRAAGRFTRAIQALRRWLGRRG